MEPLEGDGIDRGVRRLLDELTEERPAWGDQAACRITWGVLLAVTILAIAAPGIGLNDNPMDATIPLDGAYRLLHGQWPHADFTTPVGDAYYLWLGMAGLLVGAQSAKLLAVANLLVGWTAGLATWWVTRDRLTPMLRTTATLFTALLGMSPRAFDSFFRVGFNATYNRWSWTWLAVGAWIVLFPPRRDATARDAAVLAAIVVMVGWTKVTYLAALGALGLAGWMMRPEARGVLWRGLGAGGLLFAASVGLTPTGHAYLADLAEVAQAASSGPGLFRLSKLPGLATDNGWTLPLFLAIVVMHLRTLPLAARDDENGWVGGLLVVMLGGAFVAQQNNTQHIPLLPVVVLAGVLQMARRATPPTTTVRWLGAGALIASWALIGADLMAWVTSSTIVMAGEPYVATGRGPLSNLYIPPSSHDEEEEDAFPSFASAAFPDGAYIDDVREGRLEPVYVALLNPNWLQDLPAYNQDGLDLIARHGLQDRRIAGLGFSPFFHLALGTTPPRGLKAWYDWQRTYGPDEAEVACEALADTEVVMRPFAWDMPYLWDLHADCVTAEFTRVDETALWQLWARPDVVGVRTPSTGEDEPAD